jgi:hypothetical protein
VAEQIPDQLHAGDEVFVGPPDAVGVPQSGPYLQLVAEARGGGELLLQQVPEVKNEKNRLHLDLRTPDLDAEVARLTGLRGQAW